MTFLQKHRKDLLFTVILLAAAGVLFWLTHPGGTGTVAVLRYGDPQQEETIDLTKDARYDIDTGVYTIHLQVAEGGIAFVDSPCPDHTCEGFGVLRSVGDWAACLPAQASLTIEEGP